MHYLKHLFFALAMMGIIVGYGGDARAQTTPWVVRPSGVSNNLNSVACPAADTCYVVGGAPFIGGNGVILKTTNGGDAWVSQSIPVTNPLRGISCISTSRCYAAGDGGALLKTINGGTTWTPLGVGSRAGEQWYWDIWAIDANIAIAVGNAGMIFRTNNGGSTWTEIPSGTVNNFLGIHFLNASTGWILGGGSTVLRTTNGGTSWTPVPLPSGLNTLTNAHAIDLNVWISGDVGRVLKSTNGGVSFTSTMLSVPITHWSIDFSNGSNGWMVGAGGIIQKTVDGGVSWQEESSGTSVILRGVECIAATVCIAVGDDGVIIRRGSAPVAPLPPPPVSVPPSPTGSDLPISPELLRALGNALFRDDLHPDEKRSAEMKRNRATKRIKGVNINPQLLANNRIDFNFFDDITLVGELTRREEKPDGAKVWRGIIQNKPTSRVTLVQIGSSIVGNIHTPDGDFAIRPSREGGYTIREIDLLNFHPDIHVALERPRVTAVAPPPPPADVATVRIDVLVGYANDVIAWYGQHETPRALARVMIEDANQILENSNINAEFNLVGMHFMSVDENGSSEDMLSYVTSSERSEAEEIRQARRDTNADVVSVLVMDPGDNCGVGWQMGPEDSGTNFADLAYNVVAVECIDDYAIFMHEVGHNMGAAHNPEDQGGDGVYNPPRFTYSYGYRDTTGGFRTIMSYRCTEREDGTNRCPRIPYLSNPDVRFGGRVTGLESRYDNARTLTATKWDVRNFNGGTESGAGGGDAGAAEDIAASSGLQVKSLVLPGTFRYTLKSFGHAARSFFTFDPKKKAELRLNYANEKLLEVHTLIQDGKFEEGAAHLKAFQKDIEKAELLTKKVVAETPEGAKEIVVKLINSQLKHQAVLSGFKKHTPLGRIQEFSGVKKKELGRMKEVLEALGTAEQIKEVVKKVIDEHKDEEKKYRSVEILKEVEQKVSLPAKEAIKKAIEEVNKPIPIASPQKDASTVDPAASATSAKCSDTKEPLCGINGITYLNSCFAKDAGAEIAYVGECKIEKSIPPPPAKIAPPSALEKIVPPPPPTKEVLPSPPPPSEKMILPPPSELLKIAPPPPPALLLPSPEKVVSPPPPKEITPPPPAEKITPPPPPVAPPPPAKVTPPPPPVSVSPPPPPPAPPPPAPTKISPPTVSLTTSTGATSASITSGSSMTLTWKTTDADTVMLDQGIGKVAASGSLAVTPIKTTKYTLTVSNSASTTYAYLTVTVK